MKLSARNQLEGTVKEILTGAINDEVIIELPGGAIIASVITKNSVERLGLEVGKKATAIVKASDVIIGA